MRDAGGQGVLVMAMMTGDTVLLRHWAGQLKPALTVYLRSASAL